MKRSKTNDWMYQVGKEVFVLVVSIMLLVSCGWFGDENEPKEKTTDPPKKETPAKKELVSKQVDNLHAPQKGGRGAPVSGDFAKFDFATGKVVAADSKDWDIAFRGTSIIVNGGAKTGTNGEPDRTGKAAAYIASGTLDSVKEVDTSKLKQDGESGLAIPTGSDNGWYNYNSQTHIVSPIVGKVLVVRTRDEKYAKVEILNYYKDAPQKPVFGTSESPYYTFKYVYQPNEDTTKF